MEQGPLFSAPRFKISDALLQNLYENLRGVFYRCDLHSGNLISITPACEQMTGYTAEELINGKAGIWNLIHPHDRELVLSSHALLTEKKESVSIEYRLICRQGRTRWIHELSNCIKSEDGKLQFIEGYLEEITAEKNSEILTNAFDSFQRAINSGSIVSIADKNGKIIYANDLFCKYSKYSAIELAGQNHRIVNSGHHPSSFFREMWQTISKGEIWRGEIKNKAKDGTIYWVDTVIAPVLNHAGEIEQYLSIRNLITDKKNTEIRLKESEAFNKGVLASLTSQIAVIDENGYIYKVNNAWKKEACLLKSPNVQVPGEGANYLELCRTEEQNGNTLAGKVRNGILNVMEGNTGLFQLEYPCTIDEVEHWFLLSATRFADETRKVVLRQVDITQAKQTELMLAKTVKELKNKNNDLLQFNYIISHNFRAPVASILGLCNLFNLQNLSPGDKKKVEENILSAALKMDEQIKDLSSILNARSMLNNKTACVQVPRLVENVIDSLSNKIEHMGARIRISIAENARDLITIESYFQSILFNLLSNAVKYHSPVRIPEIEIKCYIIHTSFFLEVSDNGIGMDLEKTGAQLFGLYKRFNTETEGKGLGLYMSKTQTETLGGIITVSSSPNFGSTFTVQLPLIPDTSSSAPVSSRQ